MKRSIVLRLSAMFGIVSLLVFTLVGCGLFVMMERQLFAELRATLDTRTKVAEMIVSHATTAMRGRLMQEKLADLEPPDGSTHYHRQPESGFPLRHARRRRARRRTVRRVPALCAEPQHLRRDDEDRHGGR